MKKYILNDKSKAICPQCGIVQITFKYRNTLLSNTNKIVNKLLVGVCDHCDTTVTTPAQSTSAIKVVRQLYKK